MWSGSVGDVWFGACWVCLGSAGAIGAVGFGGFRVGPVVSFEAFGPVEAIGLAWVRLGRFAWVRFTRWGLVEFSWGSWVRVGSMGAVGAVRVGRNRLALFRRFGLFGSI